MKMEDAEEKRRKENETSINLSTLWSIKPNQPVEDDSFLGGPTPGELI